ncbi:methyltransferase domain-containing protein [Noviherbaspirillum sp.]|uniref:methyltransferase domain-containing protein n=1 Tax=Noviherbaspirillum sp. TaxID=1926288 RepID=UPI002D234BD6|nr:methyltransferase domain-containing protein [Noviherbaspirillum sp.]HZW22049.1 methyltransferase domain-containing protein [Noviherbaspirillum sp.]
MLTEREIESCYLGQFIPLHYHHNMLMDARRMDGFQAAIDAVVFPGAKVLELGGGTGVLSWFASARAEKVWCVEFNPELVAEARRLLARNHGGHKVEVIHADAFDYLPPEPVDVVICEMIHVGMLREKQVQMIESFKRRYRARFGDKLPVFIPEAAIMAVQPLQQDYDFNGYQAPIVQFQEPSVIQHGSLELAQPAVYSVLDFSQDTGETIQWEGRFTMAQSGRVNALRFITKNILAVLMKQGSTIDWLNHYMVLPLEEAVGVRAGDTVRVAFQYRAGGSLPSLQQAMRVECIAVEERSLACA